MMPDANTTEPDTLKWLIFTSIKCLKSELNPGWLRRAPNPMGLSPSSGPLLVDTTYSTREQPEPLGAGRGRKNPSWEPSEKLSLLAP